MTSFVKKHLEIARKDYGRKEITIKEAFLNKEFGLIKLRIDKSKMFSDDELKSIEALLEFVLVWKTLENRDELRKILKRDYTMKNIVPLISFYVIT